MDWRQLMAEYFGPTPEQVAYAKKNYSTPQGPASGELIPSNAGLAPAPPRADNFLNHLLQRLMDTGKLEPPGGVSIATQQPYSQAGPQEVSQDTPFGPGDLNMGITAFAKRGVSEALARKTLSARLQSRLNTLTDSVNAGIAPLMPELSSSWDDTAKYFEEHTKYLQEANKLKQQLLSKVLKNPEQINSLPQEDLTMLRDVLSEQSWRKNNAFSGIEHLRKPAIQALKDLSRNYPDVAQKLPGNFKSNWYDSAFINMSDRILGDMLGGVNKYVKYLPKDATEQVLGDLAQYLPSKAPDLDRRGFLGSLAGGFLTTFTRPKTPIEEATGIFKKTILGAKEIVPGEMKKFSYTHKDYGPQSIYFKEGDGSIPQFQKIYPQGKLENVKGHFYVVDKAEPLGGIGGGLGGTSTPEQRIFTEAPLEKMSKQLLDYRKDPNIEPSDDAIINLAYAENNHIDNYKRMYGELSKDVQAQRIKQLYPKLEAAQKNNNLLRENTLAILHNVGFQNSLSDTPKDMDMRNFYAKRLKERPINMSLEEALKRLPWK